MRLLPVLLALVALAGALPPVPAAAHDAPCVAPVLVPGQGPSCPTSGGWFVGLRDGAWLPTHGPDFALGPQPMAVPAAPHADCIEDPAEPHVRVLYAVPPSTVDLRDVRMPTLRAGVHAASLNVGESALPFGFDARLRVLCDAQGEVLVTPLALPTRPLQATFSTIVSDVRDLGFTEPAAKYWIAYEGGGNCGCVGQATVWDDDRPGPENLNDAGPSYAVAYLPAYGMESALAPFYKALLHEGAHVLGAVQLSAPHSTGAYHCTDGTDIMCYADGGPGAVYDPLACPRPSGKGPEMPFDCGNDDYFHPAPSEGSYLAERWNLARSRWLDVRPLAP